MLLLVAQAVAILMWSLLTARDSRNVTYLIMNLYALLTVSRGLYNSLKMYRAQVSEKAAEAPAADLKECNEN